jgi:hypothetical protein
LELLRWTLLYVRNHSNDTRNCFALADHMHNVPDLLEDFTAERLRYYWEVERPCSPQVFEEPWKVVETEYRRLHGPAEA